VEADAEAAEAGTGCGATPPAGVGGAGAAGGAAALWAMTAALAVRPAVALEGEGAMVILALPAGALPVSCARAAAWACA
jgi:hypothetical protein